jgi:hypothetical protein
MRRLILAAIFTVSLPVPARADSGDDVLKIVAQINQDGIVIKPKFPQAQKIVADAGFTAYLSLKPTYAGCDAKTVETLFGDIGKLVPKIPQELTSTKKAVAAFKKSNNWTAFKNSMAQLTNLESLGLACTHLGNMVNNKSCQLGEALAGYGMVLQTAKPPKVSSTSGPAAKVTFDHCGSAVASTVKSEYELLHTLLQASAAPKPAATSAAGKGKTSLNPFKKK